jgi:hypothetical protein
MVALTIAVGRPTAAFAQPAALDGVVHSGPRLTRTALIAGCPVFVLEAPREFFNLADDAVVLDARCTVDSAHAIPRADGVWWMIASYRRRFVVHGDSITVGLSKATRDSAVLITAALFSASSLAGKWRVEWNATVDEAEFRSLTAAIAPRPDGSALMSLRYCVNGTGGCSQSFLRRHSGRWTAVAQRFWTQIPALDDGTIGNGAGIEVRSLRGAYGVYGQSDPNCCPSRQIEVTLDQRGDSLLLRTYRITATRPPPT